MSSTATTTTTVPSTPAPGVGAVVSARAKSVASTSPRWGSLLASIYLGAVGGMGLRLYNSCTSWSNSMVTPQRLKVIFIAHIVLAVLLFLYAIEPLIAHLVV